MFTLLFLVSVLSALASARVDVRSNKVYSLHTQFTPGSLNLSTGELKLFSGHALNIIRSKCPGVDAQKIFQVQKYMGKLLAKNEPVAGKSKEFKTLLETLTTCAKEGVIPKPAEPEFDPSMPQSASSFFPYFPPFHRIRKVFIQRLPTNVDATPSSVGVDSGLILDHSTDVPQTEDPRRVISTTIFVRPEDMQEGIRTSGGFFNWIHNIFARVGGFFGRIFPRRTKRDLTEMPAPPTAADEGTALTPYQVFNPAKDEPKGKKAFGALIDQMCRIYCDACTGKKEVRNFKLAAKQLLADIFEEDSGIEAAAIQYLDDDFINSIDKCE